MGQSTSDLQEILDKHSSVFQEKLGEVVGINAQLNVLPKCATLFLQTKTSSICPKGQS